MCVCAVMCDLVSVHPREQTTSGGKEKKKNIPNLSHGKKSGFALYASTILHGLSCSKKTVVMLSAHRLNNATKYKQGHLSCC